MASRNITLNLPTDLIRKTKVEAAQRGQTLNSFVRELLEGTVTSRKRTQMAVKRMVALAE